MNICNICVSFCNPRDHNASLFYEYPAAWEKGQPCRIDAAIGCILYFHIYFHICIFSYIIFIYIFIYIFTYIFIYFSYSYFDIQCLPD